MNCNCYQELNLKLKEKTGDPSAELETAIIKNGNQLEAFPSINASYRKKKKDGSFDKKETSMNFVANYCPFCGKEIKKQAETPETSNKKEADK